MAIRLANQINLLAAQFEAQVASLTWRAVAERLARPHRRARKPKPALAPTGDKASRVYDLLTHKRETGWWTRDNKKYYRCTAVVGNFYYFRLFRDENSHHPIKVRFSTIVNRWKFLTNEELYNNDV